MLEIHLEPVWSLFYHARALNFAAPTGLFSLTGVITYGYMTVTCYFGGYTQLKHWLFWDLARREVVAKRLRRCCEGRVKFVKC